MRLKIENIFYSDIKLKIKKLSTLGKSQNRLFTANNLVTILVELL